MSQLAKDRHQRNQRQPRDGRVIVGLDLVEQDDSARFELVRPRTVERLVRRHIPLDRRTRQAPHPQPASRPCGERCAATDHDHRRDQLVSPTGHRLELVDRDCDRPRLAEDSAFKRDQLVAADDRRRGSHSTRLVAFACARALGQRSGLHPRSLIRLLVT